MSALTRDRLTLFDRRAWRRSEKDDSQLAGGSKNDGSGLAVLGVKAVIAQDSGEAKYTVRAPNGLAFSEFKGYEAWQTVAISHNER